MNELRPVTPRELADALASAASADQTIALLGRSTKQGMAGPILPSDVSVSTAGLNRVLQYEPRDLTVSVEAGLPYAELSRILDEKNQMIPLDPPFAETATVGGIVAANTCGPRRRLYGTARDYVIGMTFATVEGKLVESGGLVVKNVAGLDLAKLMIGSFGTLAAIAVINFKVFPKQAFSRTFLLGFDSPEEAISARSAILKGVLHPVAIELLNPPASRRVGREGYSVLVRAAGNAPVIERCTRELPETEYFEGPQETDLWREIQEFTPSFLVDTTAGAVVRASCLAQQLGEVFMTATEVPVLARAGSGLCYLYFPNCEDAEAWMRQAQTRNWNVVIEYAPKERKESLDLWPAPGNDLAIMKRLKEMFDSKNLLNRGRLYGRI